MNFGADWERLVLQELNQEHSRVCRARKLKLNPISIQLFDSNSLWGQFDPTTRSISISRKLIQNYSWQKVLGVFLHEMAHQFVFDSQNENPTKSIFDFERKEDKPHGEIFQKACRKLGVPAQFSKARVGFQEASLDWKDEGTDGTEEIKLLDKVKKLLALAQSSNEHEAGLAMRRVQELFAQHNLERVPTLERSQYVHQIVAEGKKRKNAWEQRIISILIEFFFVEIIILHQFNAQTQKSEQVFEIIGTRENVLMAEYVYFFLLQQLESFSKKIKNISGRERASYRLGILEGFSQKLSVKEESQRDPKAQSIARALVLFKNDPAMESYLKEIYPRLSFRKNASRLVDTAAFKAGQQIGKSLVISKPLSSSIKKPLLFLNSRLGK
jgi:phage-related protein